MKTKTKTPIPKRGEMFKLRIGKGETCWAEALGFERARIANVPFSGAYNIDDEVQICVVDGEDGYAIEALIRRQFARRASVQYKKPFKTTFAALYGAFTAMGGKVEGLVDGALVVAYNDVVDGSGKMGFDPTVVLKRLGMEKKVKFEVEL